MKSLIVYSTIVGGFYEKNDAFEAAFHAARTKVGEDAWKRGYSGSDPAGATATANFHLRDAKISPVQFDGELTYVGYVENTDPSSNVYPKLRVGIKNLGDQLLLSLDLKSDVSQRLIVKLDKCQPGDHIHLSAWPTLVPRGGRSFVNHAVSMKGADGKEIPANSLFSAGVKSQTDAVEAALKTAGINDKKVIASAKANKRNEAHKDLLLKIQARFSEAKPGA